jgi:hypothetical protein
MVHERIFSVILFFDKFNIAFMGPRDPFFYFIFLENGAKKWLFTKQTQKMRESERRRRTEKRRKIIIDPAHAFPYYEKPLLRSFFFFAFCRSLPSSKNRSGRSREKPKRITLTASQCSLVVVAYRLLTFSARFRHFEPFPRDKNKTKGSKKETCSRKERLFL